MNRIRTYNKKLLIHSQNMFGGFFNTKLGLKAQIFFIKRLSFLIRAEVPLVQALQILSQQSGEKMRSTIETITRDVSNGQLLSRSLQKNETFLGGFAIQMIQVGEHSGTLSDNLEYLAEELKKRHTLQKKVISAFVYPVVVFVATIGIVLFLILYLFPKIIPVFSSLHMQLPLSTRMLIVISKYIHDYWLSGIIGIVGLFTITILTIKKNERVRMLFDRVLLRVPLFGAVIQSYNLTHITRICGILLRSGLPLSETLQIVSSVVQNRVYQKCVENSVLAIGRGETLSSSLKKHDAVFPSISIQIISVGEASGNLASSLLYLSDFFEQEVDEFTKNVSNIIEPLLMLVMGLLVGFIAISIITPIYGITQNLHP